jgi:hypothetical protein
MAQQAPGYQSEHAAWWLSKEDLEALDQVFEREYQALGQLEEELVAETVEKRKEGVSPERQTADRVAEWVKEGRSRLKSKRTFAVVFGDKYALVEPTLADLWKKHDQHLRAASPVGFRAEIERAGISAEVELSDYGSLSIHVHPTTSEAAYHLHRKLTEWADARRPTRRETLFVESASFVAGMAALFWSFIMFSVNVHTGQSPYVQQAHELLSKGGVNPGNQDKALELMLAIGSGYGIPSANTLTGPPAWQWSVLMSLLIVCVLGGLSPRTIVGIGKGAEQYRGWSRVRRWILYVVPAFLVSTYTLPFLKRWLLP